MSQVRAGEALGRGGTPIAGLRWDREGDYVTRPHRELFADRSAVAADRIREESERTGPSYEVTGDIEGFRRVAGGDSEPDPLRAAHCVNDHVGESPIFHLKHGRCFRVGARISRAAAASHDEHQGKNPTRSEEEAHENHP
jgi:hypothetical protein